MSEERSEPVIDVIISEDELSAVLRVPEELPVTEAELKELLESRGVEYGIVPSALKTLAAGEERDMDVVCAKGRQPTNGKDAGIEYLITAGQKPDVDERGRVDFYNLNAFRNVYEDETLAIIHPATQGLPGVTVTGKKLPQSEGNPHPEFNLLAGDGVTIQDNALVATRKGIYHRATNGTLSLLEALKISGHVDFSCGNIESCVDVLITGDVLSGFRVECEGNITIEGCVENARIKATGDITIKKGITAGNQPIQAGGHLSTLYITNRKTVTAASIDVREMIDQSVVYSGDTIVSKRIAGGICWCRAHIQVQEAGTAMSTRTEFHLGEDPLVKQEITHRRLLLQDIHNRLTGLKHKQEELTIRIEPLIKKFKDIRRDPDAWSESFRERMKEKLLQENNSLKIVSDKMKKLEIRADQLTEEIDSLHGNLTFSEADFVVEKHLHRNVIVHMGHLRPYEVFQRHHGRYRLVGHEGAVIDDRNLPQQNPEPSTDPAAENQNGSP